MKKFLIIPLLLILVACQSTPKPVVLSKVNTIVIAPPDSLYATCTEPPKVPDPETLTNQQVTDFIQSIYTWGKKCKLSNDKIKQFVIEAKKIYAVK